VPLHDRIPAVALGQASGGRLSCLSQQRAVPGPRKVFPAGSEQVAQPVCSATTLVPQLQASDNPRRGIMSATRCAWKDCERSA
jgi:hypothetical protein